LIGRNLELSSKKAQAGLDATIQLLDRFKVRDSLHILKLRRKGFFDI
jgi:hypothetical protein